MEPTYQPQRTEDEAQQYWTRKQCFNVTEDLNREKFYCLAMFPYPSGSLHMGHVRNYTLADVIARYQRALGKNVLQPIGWDAFGLPAENAAIKHGIHPATWTAQNIAEMKRQIMRLGNAYDWRREITTCDPDYYRWEQWFFIKLYEKGLVYKKNAVVNWDPVDQTVLANEQVVDGCGWRSGAPVERREIQQWFLKITAYADTLLSDLDTLTHWPAQVKLMQQNWIGRSEGCEIKFFIPNTTQKIKIYTTRADTLMGATYLAIAPEHPVAKTLADTKPAVADFIASCQGVSTAEAELAHMEKRGIDTGLTATHPITGEAIPIWIANFVLMQFGHGAVMCVPAHDQRDFEFAQKYHLPISIVVIGSNPDHDYTQQAMTEKGILCHSGAFTHLASDHAATAIADYLHNKHLGKKTVHYRLRDWGISRQRYWGTPIPMVTCDDCGIVPVAESDLPVSLPEHIDLTGSGSALAQCPAFYQTTCPKCGQDATRETDTMDTFMESSWYYARFACRGQENAMLDDRAKYWTPVDQYIGGIEHAVMHLLYARFFHKLMRDEGLVNTDEPFVALLTQGMVLKDGHKMSKSKGNTVDPNALIDKYGADTARLFVLFAAPPEQSLEWSDAGVEGAYRYLKRLWAFAVSHRDNIMHVQEAAACGNHQPDWQHASADIRKSRQTIHQILSQILTDYEKQQFNTVVSGCMKLLNELNTITISHEMDEHCIHEGFSILLRTLAPIAPHICHQLWHDLGFEGAIIDAPWPRVDKMALKAEEVEYIVQINGKIRTKFMTHASTEEPALIALAKDALTPLVGTPEYQKIIVVAHRKLINLVVR